MFRRRMILLIICLLLVAMVKPGSGNGTSAIEDRETVYALLDPYGRPRELSVVDWLRVYGTGTRTVFDPGDLTAIENVKGPERPKKVQGGLLWQVDCRGGYKDLFYRGRTTRSLPFAIKIAYFLDGREVPATKVPGAKGELLVRITIQNWLRVKEWLRYKNARGETVSTLEELVVPLAVNITTDVPATRFHRIEAPEANTTAVGATMKLSWLVFPYPEVELTLRLASKTGMSLEPIYFTAMPMLPPLPEVPGTDQLLPFVVGLKTMDGKLAQMVEGTEKLYRGQGDLFTGSGTIQAGLADLARLNEAHQEIVRRCLAGLAKADLTGVEAAFGRLAELEKGLAELEEGLSVLGRLIEAHQAVMAGMRAELGRFDLAPVASSIRSLDELGQALGASEEYLGRAASSVEVQAKRALAAKNRQEEMATALAGLAKSYPGVVHTPEYKELQRLFAAQEKDLAALTAGSREGGKSIDGLGTTARLLTTMVERVEKGKEGIATLNEFAGRAGEMTAGLDRLRTALGVLAEGGELEGRHVPGLKTAAEGLLRAKEGVSLMRQGMGSFTEDGKGLLAGLQGALTELRTALEVLLSGGPLEGQQVPGLATAGEGLMRLAAGLEQLRTGLEQVRDGTQSLRDGLVQMRLQGTQKTIADLEETLDELARAAATKKVLTARVAACDHFIGKPTGAKGQVRFLLRTEALR
ncbi:MAG: hypothetical protein GX493_00880 [Firmicutes bacterium]|nr:hypothetical protein [Bacillota bacterium]